MHFSRDSIVWSKLELPQNSFSAAIQYSFPGNGTMRTPHDEMLCRRNQMFCNSGRKENLKRYAWTNEGMHFQKCILAFCIVVSHNAMVASHDSQSADFYGQWKKQVFMNSDLCCWSYNYRNKAPWHLHSCFTLSLLGNNF